MKIDFRKINTREKVSAEDLAKAKESGVVQLKPNGSWGIISIEKGEWWVPDYESEDAAKAALKAYHAGRFGNSREALWSEAEKLVRQYSPEATDEEVKKLVSFGFHLAYKPQDFIDTLKEKLAERNSNSWHGKYEFPDHGVVYICRPKYDKSGAPAGESKDDKIGFIASNPNKLSRFLESKGYVLMQDSDYLDSETRVIATIIMYLDEFPNLTWFDKSMQEAYFAATQDRRGRAFNGRHQMWNFPDKGCVAILRPYSDKSRAEYGMGMSDHILVYDLPNQDEFAKMRMSLIYQSKPLHSERELLDEASRLLERNKALTWLDEDQHKAYAAAMQDLYHRNVNSALTSGDTQIIDKRSRDIIDHMDTDFKRIIKEIADEMGQNVPEYTNINDAQTYYEMLMGEQSISDRMFSAIDYAFGIYFGYKLGRKKNSMPTSISEALRKIPNVTDIFKLDDGVQFDYGGVTYIARYAEEIYLIILTALGKFDDSIGDLRYFKEPLVGKALNSIEVNVDNLKVALDTLDKSVKNLTLESIRGMNSITEVAAVVLRNPDGTHEVVSVESDEDWARIDSYQRDDHCTLVATLDNTKEADNYIEEHKLRRANSRQNNSEAASLLQRLKSICLGTGFTPAYDSEYERIELVSNGLIYVIENEENEIVLMDYDEKVLFKSRNVDEVLDEVKKALKGQRSQNGRDAQKEYAFLMLSYDTPEFIKNLQSEIPAEELYVGAEGEEDRYGLETQSHISVLPCLSNSTKLNDLIHQLPELSTLGANLVNISVFECDDYDVLKADVMFDSPIAGLHDELDKEFKTHSEYEFHPHMTIAYMQKGKAAQYAKELSEPVYVVPKSYAYSFWTKGKMKEVYFS